MGGLVAGNELQIDEEILVETRIEEVLQFEPGECFAVEGVLKVFELEARVRHNGPARNWKRTCLQSRQIARLLCRY